MEIKLTLNQDGTVNTLPPINHLISLINELEKTRVKAEEQIRSYGSGIMSSVILFLFNPSDRSEDPSFQEIKNLSETIHNINKSLQFCKKIIQKNEINKPLTQNEEMFLNYIFIIYEFHTMKYNLNSLSESGTKLLKDFDNSYFSLRNKIYDQIKVYKIWLYYEMYTSTSGNKMTRALRERYPQKERTLTLEDKQYNNKVNDNFDSNLKILNMKYSELNDEYKKFIEKISSTIIKINSVNEMFILDTALIHNFLRFSQNDEENYKKTKENFDNKNVIVLDLIAKVRLIYSKIEEMHRNNITELDVINKDPVLKLYKYCIEDYLKPFPGKPDDLSKFPFPEEMTLKNMEIYLKNRYEYFRN